MSFAFSFKTTVAAGAVAAAALSFGAVGASAATISFNNFKSTNANDQLHPELTITEIDGGFEVSSKLISPESGSLVAMYFDLGDDWSANDFDGLRMVTVSPSPNAGVVFNGDFFEAGVDAKNSVFCGKRGNLSGGLDLPLVEGIACFGKTTGAPGAGKDYNPVVLQITDADGVLSLDSFMGVGIRYMDSSNSADSDKLFSATRAPAPIPLPAGGLLLLGALGGLGIAARRRRRA